MSPFLQLAFELLVILLAAKAAGALSARLGQPSVLGELVAGALLGPSLVNILGFPFIDTASLGQTLTELSQLGVVLLMFLAGLELHIGELAQHRKVSFISSLGGLLLSIGLGWAAGRLFGLDQRAAFLLGIALGATSVSISARTLMEFGILRSRVGLSLLGAAVVDDILSILAFSIFLAVTSGDGSLAGLAWTAARMALFLAAASAFGWWVVPVLSRWVARLRIGHGSLALALVVLLLYGLAAELLGGMAALIGAFLAGLMFARTPEKGLIEAGMNSLAYGLFVPIFFVDIGLTVDLHALRLDALWLILAVALAAVAGKWIGAAGAGRLAGLPGRDAIQMGAGMVARGEVTLIVSALGMQEGLIGSRVFSALIAAVLLTTLLTPSLMRAVYRRPAIPAEGTPPEPAGKKRKAAAGSKPPASKLGKPLPKEDEE